MVSPTEPTIAVPILEKALSANPYSFDLILALIANNLMLNKQSEAMQLYAHASSFIPQDRLEKAGLRLNKLN